MKRLWLITGYGWGITRKDIQDALKDLLGSTIKEMIEAEMDDHLGYQKSERYDSDDYRNGYKTKRVNSSFGSLDIQVPKDRKSSFEPKVVKKRQKDISNIDQKIISISYDTTDRVCDIVKLIKQQTTYYLWQKYPNFLSKQYWKKIIFWSDGYFACSIGEVSSAAIQKYIESQG